MKLCRIQEEDGTVIMKVRGHICFSTSLPHFDKLAHQAKEQDSFVGLLFHQHGSELTVHPGDGPAIAAIFARVMQQFRNGAVIAIVCSDPLNFLRHQEIHRHMELPPHFAIRAFMDENTAREWLSLERKNLRDYPSAIQSELWSTNPTRFASFALADS